MTTNTIMTAIVWGAISGVLGTQLLINLLGMLFCLHGLLQTRWKRLTHKAAAGQVKYMINLQLLLRISLYALLFAGLLQFGDNYVQRKFWFEYRDNATLLLAIFALLAAVGFLPAARRRLRVIWRMSHECDYAERRQRTRMLKS